MDTVFVPVNVAPKLTRLILQLILPTALTREASAFMSLISSHKVAITAEANGSPCFSSDGAEVSLNLKGRMSTSGKANVKEETAFPCDE